eukprot:3888902-Rhodomonas_salina.1
MKLHQIWIRLKAAITAVSSSCCKMKASGNRDEIAPDLDQEKRKIVADPMRVNKENPKEVVCHYGTLQWCWRMCDKDANPCCPDYG